MTTALYIVAGALGLWGIWYGQLFTDPRLFGKNRTNKQITIGLIAAYAAIGIFFTTTLVTL